MNFSNVFHVTLLKTQVFCLDFKKNLERIKFLEEY